LTFKETGGELIAAAATEMADMLQKDLPLTGLGLY
jgi:hypothetical protein